MLEIIVYENDLCLYGSYLKFQPIPYNIRLIHVKHIAVQQEKNYNFAIIIIIMDPFNNIIKGPFNITPTLLKDLKLTKESFHVIDFQDRLDNVEEKNISKHLRKCKKYKKKEKNMSKHLRKCKKKK